MSLSVDQTILGAVQEGTCAEIDAVNPYSMEDKKRYFGWKEGHEGAVKDYNQQKKYDSLTSWQKFKCWLGIHEYTIKKLPGRPHIDNATGDIISRDPIVKKYTCIYCNDSFLVGVLDFKRPSSLKRNKRGC